MKIHRKPKPKIKFNTTALPDIIFMLLFFFMMSTVIQDDELKELTLPEFENWNAMSKKDDNSLYVYLGQNTEGQNFRVNDKSARFEHHTQLLVNELNNKKQNGFFINQAFLYINANTPMQQVNLLKEQLQKLEIYKVHYIHAMD